MSNDGHLKSEYRQALDETDTNRQTANRWQTIADMPGETFEQHIVEQQEAGRELTTAGMLRVAQQLRQKEERAQTARNAFNLELQGARYRTIVIDPPWPVQKILRDERPNQDLLDYPTMTIEEIARLPLAELADAEACHLYLWTTHKFLPDALELVQGWGFRYECLMTWVKPTGMTPFSWMYNTEHVLFCRMGNLRLERMGLKLSFEAPVTKHSEKPDIFYELVCQASPRPRLEMFARRPRAGFYVWGNEVNAATA